MVLGIVDLAADPSSAWSDNYLLIMATPKSLFERERRRERERETRINIDSTSISIASSLER